VDTTPRFQDRELVMWPNLPQVFGSITWCQYQVWIPQCLQKLW